MTVAEIPKGARVTYRRQYRRCGKPNCPTCQPGSNGHGPYWYAFWREDGRLRSRYLGKEAPAGVTPQHMEAGSGASPVPEPPALRVRTLGAFAVYLEDTPIFASCWSRQKVLGLFACLLTVPEHRLRREQLIDMLWPDGDAATGAKQLRSTIHLLRKLLVPGEAARGAAAGVSAYVRSAGDLLILDPAPGRDAPAGWLDLHAFEAAAAAALAGRDPAACRQALALYTGDYLQDHPYEEWLAARREELRRRRWALAIHLASICSAADDSAAAATGLQAVLAAEPTDEIAARTLMILLARLGRHADALRVYQGLQAALRDELDESPAPETEAVHRRLQTQAARAGGASLPRRSPHNLPAPVTSFVGRALELAEIRALLEARQPSGPGDGRQVRLLTLIGAGGCGKSRLALEVAGAVAGAYPDGVWLVDLASLSDPSLLAQTVALTLGIREGGAKSPGLAAQASLIAALQAKHLLLLLDSCEHLIGAVAGLTAALLGACPGLRILATSREALAIAGETAWRVPSLSLPKDGELGEGVAPAPEHLAAYEAIQLFLDRARARRPAFAVTAANAIPVLHVCRQLDGIPLAIELAAARMDTMSVESLATRLDDRFRLLTEGNRVALPRQQTLRATMDWSHALLTQAERAVFRRLSVFAGGWTIEAAESICADAPASIAPSVPERNVLETLSHLVAKSLVQIEDAGVGDSLRYRLLETVRHYAREQLDAVEDGDRAERQAGEAATVRHRHRDWYLHLAEEAEGHLLGAMQAHWLDRLEQEHDNLRAALAWSRARPSLAEAQVDPGLRLAAALWRFWMMRGYSSEGRRWLDEVLSQDCGDTSDDAGAAAWQEARARALNGAGNLAHRQGDFARAAALYAESLSLRRLLGDKRGIAGSLNNLGNVEAEQGQYAPATALYEESLSLRRELDDAVGVAASLGNLGGVARDRGDYGRAVALHEESLALWRRLGDRRGVASALLNLGLATMYQGETQQAGALYQESLALFRELGDKGGVALSLTNLGTLVTAQGEPERAAALHRRALALFGEVGDKRGIAWCLDGLAGAAQWRGESVRAARLYGAAEALRQAIGASPPPGKRAAYAAALAALAAALDEKSLAAALAWGRAVPMEEAVAFAGEDAGA